MKGSKSPSLAGLLLFAFFLFPYAIFLKHFGWQWHLSWSEVRWALLNSAKQAGGAAALSVLLGVPMSFGLLRLPVFLRAAAEKMLLLPQVLPALYSLLIAFSVWNPFPMGTGGVVRVFVLINLGFAALLALRALQSRLGPLALTAEVYGVGKAWFFFRIYLPLMWRDLVVIFFIIFTFCLSSFSVPLIAGGGKGVNLEVLIYEKIFVEQNWDAALVLSVLQTGWIFLASVLIFRAGREGQGPLAPSAYIRSWVGVALIVFYLGIYVGGYLSGLYSALKYIPIMFFYVWDLAAAAAFTLRALFWCLLVNGTMLALWVLDFIRRDRFTPAVHLISLSTVVTGFAIYLIFPVSSRYDLLKIALGVTLLLFPALFRYFLQGPVESLRPQIAVARIYGLSPVTIMVDVIFRQIRRPLYTWVSFLALWFSGDYAVMKALGVQSQTLGLMSAGFLSSYRLPLSYLMSFNILVFWLVAMVLIYLGVRAGYVIYKKFTL